MKSLFSKFKSTASSKTITTRDDSHYLYIEGTRIQCELLFPSFLLFFFSLPYFALWSHFYFHSSLFPSSRNSGSPSRARDPSDLSSSAHCHTPPLSVPVETAPHQIKLESLTRHAGNRHIYLYLRLIRLGNSGIFLKFLRLRSFSGDARQYRMSLISDLSFESFSSRGHFSFLASKASTPCRLIQSVVQRDLD